MTVSGDGGVWGLSFAHSFLLSRTLNRFVSRSCLSFCRAPLLDPLPRVLCLRRVLLHLQCDRSEAAAAAVVTCARMLAPLRTTALCRVHCLALLPALARRSSIRSVASSC